MEEQGLGHLFITSSSPHFFNKTDLEQHLSKATVWNILPESKNKRSNSEAQFDWSYFW